VKPDRETHGSGKSPRYEGLVDGTAHAAKSMSVTVKLAMVNIDPGL
jgi:hypothetical protein